MAEPRNPQQQLEWEARQRPRAAIAAALAALLLLSDVVRQLLLSDVPHARLLDPLRALEAPGPVDARPSALVPVAQYVVDHKATILVSSITLAVGYFALAYLLTFLAAAVRARRAQLPTIALYLPAIGAVLLGTASIAYAVGLLSDQQALLDGPHTIGAARDASSGGLHVIAGILFLPAQLALAAAYVLVSINAMRAGLLTRFMGILGAIVGAFTVFQIGPVPVVQSVWLVAMAVLLIGQRPAGDPPAWRTGREEPWPSPQEQAAARGAKGRAPAPEPEREPVAVAAGPHPATSKRKRKRRR